MSLLLKTINLDTHKYHLKLIDPLTDNYIIGNNYHLDYIGNCKIFDFNQLFEADKEII